MINNKRICVVFGGNSTEREVSLITGKAYVKALKKLKYDVVELDVNNNVIDIVNKISEIRPACIVNGLHGGAGENGNWQAIFNLLKIPYTHSGVTASSMAMNKFISGAIFEKYGIPIPKTKIISSERVKEQCMPFPYVIKPIDGGSSVGVYIINSKEELISLEWNYGDTAMVQEYIPGRELTVGIVEEKALAVTEIVPKNGFYDYKTKYSEGAANHILPADISQDIRERVMCYAEIAYKALGCRGAARVDFRYNDSKDEVYILEINTQPGMTELSLLPEQVKFRGGSFQGLVQWMIENACCDKQ